MPDCAPNERELIETAIKWRRSKYAVAEAIHYQDLRHAVDKVIKERRDLHGTTPPEDTPKD